jgi:radical SAM superfamily enzyme YgiQ (UPF0313 family)
MKITLVFPARDREPIGAAIRTPPAGISRLAALVPEGTSVTLVDMLAGDLVDFDDPGDLIGVTVRTPIAGIAYRIADRLRESGATVVLGGPHASAVPRDAAEHADAVVVGEAETTWPRLLADFSAGSLRRFYVCGPMRFDPAGESLVHEPELPSLEGLPHARRDLAPGERYTMDSMFTTRGCPYDCSFCPVPGLFGSTPRHRPIEEVVSEVETLGPVYFNLDDNIFGVPGDEDYYLELYAELSKPGRRRAWTGQGGLGAVASSKGREILQRAVKSGLVSVSVGIESVSPLALEESGAWRKLPSMRNDPGLEKTAEQIRAVQDLGVFVIGWFVIGWDGDDKGTYARSIEFADRTGIAPIVVNLLPMPGTRCYDDLARAGRLRPDLTWDDYELAGSGVYSHPTLSGRQMVNGSRRAMRRGYSWRRVLRRSRAASSHHPGLRSFLTRIAIQRNLKRAFGG